MKICKYDVEYGWCNGRYIGMLELPSAVHCPTRRRASAKRARRAIVSHCEQITEDSDHSEIF